MMPEPTDAEFHDGLHNAAKYWRQLQEARRENADLRAKGAHLAAEQDRLRRTLGIVAAERDELSALCTERLDRIEDVEYERDQLRAELADLHAQRDNLARILNCVKTMIAPLMQEET